ncbi:MAG TPA: RagB/SusD family nutrient uptake outer membrane protein [Gemmatimonadaceae bacterium]|nr:RagB/SusD family nutrient uptake outer membrane protein [Gemmatimonadaceae bacterium]
MTSRNRRRAPWAICTALALTLVTTVACRDITTLQQKDPSHLDASTLFVPANAQLLVNGAISDFECAYNRYVVGSGILSDELVDAISFIANYDYDRRTMPTSAPYGTNDCNAQQVPGVYTPLSVARASADTILAKLEGWTDEEVPNRTKLIGQSAAYAGYSLLLLGEGMCSAAINIGPEMTPDQLFAEAKSRFDKAIDAASTAGDATTLHFAQLGRARAYLDMGDLTNAATDAAEVPEGFIVAVNTDAADVRRQNLVHVHIAQGNFSSVDPSFRNVMWGTAADPRVAVTDLGFVGTDGHTELWLANKYSEITSPMPIAKWQEAQLILAEAAVAANDLDGAASIINALHAAAGIPTPAYDAAGKSQEEVMAQVIEERRRELFLEGHRLGDIRRYDLPLVPAPGSPYVSGGTYGDQRCFPLPDVERIHNPNL